MRRLQAAADSGGLDDLAQRHGVRVMTVFGSTARGEPDARDLDIGVLFEAGGPRRSLVDDGQLIHELEMLTGTVIDVAVVDKAGPLFRDRALARAVPVWESEAGAWLEAAVDAEVTRMDTDWLRRLDLERRAGV